MKEHRRRVVAIAGIAGLIASSSLALAAAGPAAAATDIKVGVTAGATP